MDENFALSILGQSICRMVQLIVRSNATPVQKIDPCVTILHMLVRY